MSTFEELRIKHAEPVACEMVLRLCPCCLLVDTHDSGRARWGGSYCVECETYDSNGFPKIGSRFARMLVLDAIEPLTKRDAMNQHERNRAAKAFGIIHDEWEWRA